MRTVMWVKRDRRPTLWLFAVCVAACVASCAVHPVKPAVEPSPAEPPPADQETPVVEAPAPEPPSEAELAIQAAAEAEARGDYETALELYGWASVAQGVTDREGEIHYRRGMLYVDPDTGMMDLAQARREFEQVTGALPRSDRYREARVMLKMLDDLESARTDSASLREQIEALKGEVASLKSDLAKKEQELNNIKQVLLQKNP